MAEEPEIDYRFSTPICRTELTGFEQHRAGLAAHVNELRETTEGIQSSNYLGWHSDRNLHIEPKNPDMQWLVKKISIKTVQLIQRISGSESGVDVRLRELWANINDSGGWNVPHVHPVSWAGVVYVTGGAEKGEEGRRTPSDLKEGDTVFLNPVAIATLFGQKNFSNYGAMPGYMLLFPGYLSHMVVPHTSPDQRITFAFNIDIVKKQQRRPAAQAPIPEEHARPRVNVIV